jgi:hypothetical protein
MKANLYVSPHLEDINFKYDSELHPDTPHQLSFTGEETIFRTWLDQESVRRIVALLEPYAYRNITKKD